MSVVFLPVILGPEMAAPFLWAPGIFWFFLLENPMHIKFLVLGGGESWVFWKGGWNSPWKCQFYFYGRGDFSDWFSFEFREKLELSLEGREPPLTLRRENQYLYFGCFFPCTPGPFSCSTGFFPQTGPVLQEFGFVLRVGVRHSTSVLRPLPWG